MNDALIASLIAPTLLFVIAFTAIKRGWLRVTVDGGELQQLREQVDKLLSLS